MIKRSPSMDAIFNETDDSEENLSKISSKTIKYKNLRDIKTMNDDVSFSMIVDKNSPQSESLYKIHSQPAITRPISIDQGSNLSDEYSDETEEDYECDFDKKVERMMTAETPPDPFITIQTRTRLKWVDDSNAHRCGLCNQKFRMFLRRHHCIVEGTPVTLNNGMARKIEDMIPNQKLPSWNSGNQNVDNNNHVEALLDQGYEPCMKVMLEDGREITATSDHEILTISPNEQPKYVMMKDLTTNHRLVCSVLEGVLDDPSLDRMNYVIPNTPLSIKSDRDKCLAFARLCGYSLTDGNIAIDSNRCVFIMGDSDDSEAICQDIELITKQTVKRPQLTNTGKATVYRVEFNNKLLKTLLTNVGVTVGNKVDKGMRIPNFMWDDNCPKSIQREFIAGWFGGDGSRFGTINNGKNLKTNYHLVSVSLQGKNSNTVLKNAMMAVKRMNEVIKSFGIESEVVITNSKATIKGLTTVTSKIYTDINPIITCRIGFKINLTNMVHFNKKIGFRYCIDKQSKMSVGASYENYRNRLANQRVKLINVALDIFLLNNDKYKDPRLHDSDFRQKSPTMTEMHESLVEARRFAIENNFDNSIIIDPTYKGFDKIVSGQRRTYESCTGKILANSNTMNFNDFLKNVDFDWNAPSREGKRYYSLQIVGNPTIYNDGKLHHVYDLSVPGNVSFVANGILVHNCRICGSVFCGTCSDNWNTIPECITHVPSANGVNSEIDRTSPLRMCDTCSEKIVLVKKLEILLKSVQKVEMDIFAFKTMSQQSTNDITDSFIKQVNDIPDIKEMKDPQIVEFAKTFMNGKLWKQLANFYLSKFREIQYKLPYQEYTEWERTALWTNYKHLKDHDVWMVHVIRAFVEDRDKLSKIVTHYFDNSDDFDDVVIKDRDECWDRMCTRMCQKKLSWESALMLLDVISKDHKTRDGSDQIRKILTTEIVKAFNRCDDYILECIIPCITYRLVYDDINEILIDFTVTRCSNSKRIANHVYWALIVDKTNNARRCDYLISRLFRGISRDTYDAIMKVNNFVRTIEDNYVGKEEYENPIKDLGGIGTCVSPTNPENGVQTVSEKVLPGEMSANRPVPIILSPDTESENIILYKTEDLRTDLIVMSIIRFMAKTIEDSLGIDLHVVTYNIQPVTTDSGFIGAVGKSQTLYKIEEKLKSSLANYVQKHNPNTPIRELKERFSRSCAFYSVMTFLLGIGDRHLDNIMLTEMGELFHIDYGFILGKDPRPMKSPYMRISEGMLDAIGGYHSEEYNDFKELCYQIYEISRRHVNTFVCMLSLLPKQNTGGTWTNPKISDNRVLIEIVKRFAPGETYEKAKSILHTRIDKSTNMTNRSKYHVVDFFHRHNKEGTLRNIVSTTVGYGWSGTTNMMSGIWDYVSRAVYSGSGNIK